MSRRRRLILLGVFVAGAIGVGWVGLNKISHKSANVTFSSDPPKQLRPGTLPDTRLLLSPRTRTSWLLAAEKTLSVAREHPRRIATFASFVSATKTTITVRALPVAVPAAASPHVYTAYTRTPRLVTFALPGYAYIHLTTGRSLTALRAGTPLFVGGVRDSATGGGLRIQLVTDLGDLARSARRGVPQQHVARSTSPAEALAPASPTVTTSASSATAEAGTRELASVTESPADVPPPSGVLLRNLVALNPFGLNQGIDWTGALKFGDQSGCPYLNAGVEIKAGASAEWHWPFTFSFDSSSQSLSVTGIDQSASSGFRKDVGFSDPGADQSYYLGLGAAAGLDITIGCHVGAFAFFSGAGFDWTLVGLGFHGMLANETSERAPISADRPVPPTDCLAFGAQPLNSLPSWVPFRDKLNDFAEFAISGCADVKITGQGVGAVVHGAGPSARADPQTIALTSSSDPSSPGQAAVDPYLTAGHSLTVDHVNYQPLLHLGLGLGLHLGHSAKSVLKLGDKLQAALHGGRKAGKTTFSDLGEKCGDLGPKPFVPERIACEIAHLDVSARISFDWPHALEMVSPTILGQPVTLSFTPVVAPPTEIAFIRSAQGDTSQPGASVYVMNADGSGRKKLTALRSYVADPAWSPDGKQIAFDVNVATAGSSQIHVMNADGSGQRELTTPIAAADPAWSPDGKKIAFRSYEYPGGIRRIYVMNTDGTGLTKLTDGPADLLPTWSPDGKKIAFERDGDSGSQPTAVIDVINVDGSGLTQLTNDGFAAQDPAWSPNGRKIAFVGGASLQAGEGGAIYTVNVDGSGQTLVSKGGPYDIAQNSPTWSPDGRKIAFVAFDVRGPSNIMVVNADGSGQTRVTRNSRAEDVDPAWQPKGTPAGASSSSAGSTSTPSTLPTLLGDAQPVDTWQVRPAVITYTGDSSGILGGFQAEPPAGHLTWLTWMPSEATAIGAVWLDDCVPDCASGTFHPSPVRVRAFRVINNHFRRLTLTYTYEGTLVVDKRSIRRFGGYWQYDLG